MIEPIRVVALIVLCQYKYLSSAKSYINAIQVAYQDFIKLEILKLFLPVVWTMHSSEEYSYYMQHRNRSESRCSDPRSFPVL